MRVLLIKQYEDIRELFTVLIFYSVYEKNAFSDFQPKLHKCKLVEGR
jgi:hypothetical protein